MISTLQPCTNYSRVLENVLRLDVRISLCADPKYRGKHACVLCLRTVGSLFGLRGRPEREHVALCGMSRPRDNCPRPCRIVNRVPRHTENSEHSASRQSVAERQCTVGTKCIVLHWSRSRFSKTSAFNSLHRSIQVPRRWS